MADADHPNGQQLDDEYEDDEIVTVEATGKTVEEAVQKALDELGLEEDEVEVEILSEGSKGVLGLGGELARVRVTSLPYEDEEYDEGEEFDEEAYAEDEEYEEDEIARQVLTELLERMEIPAEVSLDSAEMDEESGSADQPLPSIELSITGEYMGILIGRHGDTLAALQFLLGLLVSRKAERRVRVMVDVEGYRERRARQLRDMALRAADRAQRYRQPIFMDPMIPAERRIVHLTLANHPYVTTNSIGEGDNRRVVISPKTR